MNRRTTHVFDDSLPRPGCAVGGGQGPGPAPFLERYRAEEGHLAFVAQGHQGRRRPISCRPPSASPS